MTPPDVSATLSHVRLPQHADNRDPEGLLEKALAGEGFLLFDGAMGTQLQALGLPMGAVPELLCITDPASITKIHRAYVEAGSQVVTTNTFGANAHKLGDAAGVADVFEAAVACARASGARYVAADIGPTGELLQPMGTLSFDEAYQLFAEQVHAAVRAGVDLFVVETMSDLLEAKAALLAIRENCDLPAFVTMTFGEDGRTFLGTTPEIAAITLSSLGAAAVGINCSLGPDEVAPLVSRMLPWAKCPIMAQPNAGLPQMHGSDTVYAVTPEDFAASIERLVESGVSIVGGCCGTSPSHIREVARILEDREVTPRDVSEDLCVTSAQEVVSIPLGHVGSIGERINPTGKRRMQAALRSGNLDLVLSEAIAQVKAGAQILDVNAGLPDIDERACLVRLVQELQSVTTAPLQIDSADPAALEAAVRIYPGKPIINSANGKQESLESVLPIARHYGCAVVCLTLDEDGIPATARGRLEIARKIVSATDELGLPRQDVIIDCLCMAASTDQAAPGQVLEAIRLVKSELQGVRTVLGVSNVSFGLPCRELVNATFLSAAFAAGLDLAIVNPLSQRYQDVFSTWRVLTGEDVACARYVEQNASRSLDATTSGVAKSRDDASGSSAQGPDADSGARPTHHAISTDKAATLSGTPCSDGPQSLAQSVHDLVISGRKAPMRDAVGRLLGHMGALEVIDGVLIPALDEVGDRFEHGTFFLPQLMASAEAAKEGFATIEDSQADSAPATKGKIAIATVRGDIHDIGKNIVTMLLGNYGYDVIDLGRDVDPELFANTVASQHIELAGLSALMTTTIGAMRDTICLIRERAPWCKVMVGGAVLNPEYTSFVGADYYAKDAAESARIAALVFGDGDGS